MKYILLSLCLLIAVALTAQEKMKREYGSKLPTFARVGEIGDRTYILPEFYNYFSEHKKDTTWKFECYDSRDSILNIDTVKNIKDVWFISLFKSYTDSAHTYKDSDGKKKLLPVSSIIKRYDRQGKDKWMCIDYAHNKYTQLKEFPGEIVKTDTTIIVDPVTGKEESKYYKYYKVIPVK